MRANLLMTLSRKQRIAVTAAPRVLENALSDFLTSTSNEYFSHYRKVHLGNRIGFEFFCCHVRGSKRFNEPMTAGRITEMIPHLNLKAKFPRKIPINSKNHVKGWEIRIIKEKKEKGVLMSPTWCKRSNP